MKKQFSILNTVLITCTLLWGMVGIMSAQVTLILPNSSTANYSTIEAAYAAINFTTNAGAHFIELESAYTGEASYPLTLGAITGASATNKVTIRPAAGQTKVLEMTSSSSAPITTITTSAAANTTTKFMTSATGLSAGMKLAGYGIVGSPANFTTISDITDGVVTMATNFSWNASFNGAYSTMIACPTSGTILKVASPTYINSTTLDYSSITTGIVANMIVGGNAIQPGTTIVSATLNSPSAGKTRVVLSKALVSGNQTTPTLYCTDPSTGVYVIPTGFQMPVSSTIGVAIGMTVVGTGVGSGFTGAVNVVKVGATDVYTNASGTYAASAALTFTTPGALNPAIKFDGAKYVTIDGQSGGVGGTKNLTLSNTLTFNNASTLYFVNDASYNTIKYCNILGSSVSSTSNPTTGTVFISTTTGTTARAGSDPNFTGSGNLNNTIDNCDIANASGGLPTVGVYMNGTATYTNESNTISNCNIYNYFNPGAFVSAGIYINDNTKTTTINANKFYQTAERTYTHVSGEGINYGIFSATGSSDSKAFTNNIIGYSSNSQTGTMTLNGNKNFRFVGIYVGRPLATAYGNLITDIDISTSSVGATHAGTVTGIYAANNFPAATALSPNIIRNIIVRPSASTGGTATTHTLCGLGAQGGSAPLFYYNNVYNLQVIPTSDAVVSKLTGIYIGAGANTAVKFSNIYDLTCGASGNTGAHTVTGIYSVGISQYGGTNINTVERNLVYNLKAISSGSSGFPTIIGITGNCEYAGKTSVFKNNFIALGENVMNDAIIYGILQPTTDATNLLKYYHNSVYIGGAAPASPTKNTFAFYSAGTTVVTTGTNELKNNIFYNQRTITGTGKHYAIGFATGSVLKTCDYNLYYASPVGLAIAVEKVDLTAWKDAIVAGSDASSITANPQFIAPNATTPNLQVQTYSSAVAAKGASGTGVTDDYNGTTRAATPAIGAYEFTYASAASDNYKSLATGNWGAAATWQSSVDNSNWANATLVPGATSATVTIQNAHTVSLDANATTSSLTLNSGSLLNVNAGKQLTVSTTLNNSGTLNLLSTSEDGTATILTPVTLGGTGGTYNVQQWLTGKTGTSTRAIWYLSSPVSGATAAVFDVAAGTNKMTRYDEAVPGYVSNFTSNAIALTPGVGYVAYNGGADAVYSFTGGSLNTGAITIPVTRTGTSAGKRGFNLVGNPYPSYLDWKNVSNTKTNLRSTIWYRTSVGTGATMTTDTYDGTTGTNNNNKGAVTQYIAPMQAFWVKVDKDGDVATLAFANAARLHRDQSLAVNSLRAPAQKATETQIVRLRVSNGTNSDEAILVADANAADALDAYDSEKMSNDNVAIPEIYTLAGSQELVINHLSDFAANKQVALGFRPGTINNFSIVANEISNIDAQTKVILIDKQQNNAEFDLTDGNAYTFSADATPTTNRFVIAFRAPGVATNLSNANNLNMFVYSNANNQITINRNSDKAAKVTVCNTMGQKLVSTPTTGSTTVIQKSLGAGVYFVSLIAEGNESTQKVIIK